MLKNSAMINLTVFMLMMQYKCNHHIPNEVRQCFRTADNWKPFFFLLGCQTCVEYSIYIVLNVAHIFELAGLSLTCRKPC